MTNAHSIDTSVSKQLKNRSTKRLTTADFIAKAKVVHAEHNYDYSKVDYVNGKTKVEIVCAKHGSFFQAASSHLCGRKCRQCGIESRVAGRTYSIDDFIRVSNKSHGGKYGYDKVVYKTSQTEVIISCPEHGDFSQLAAVHLLGHGCPNCVGVAKLSTAEFINRAVGVHGNLYSYDRSIYTLIKNKITVTCKIHGDYDVIAADHLNGSICGKCSGHKPPSTTEFIERAKTLHGSKYTYEKTHYTKSHDKVVITCPVHGDFTQKAYSHYPNGRGCPKCRNGFVFGRTRTDFIDAGNRYNGDATLYAIKCTNEDELFYKVGITVRSVDLRFNNSNMPYSYEVLYSLVAETGYIYDIEKSLHKALRHNRYEPKLPFGGFTECFTTIKPIEKLLKELSITEQLQLLA